LRRLPQDARGRIVEAVNRLADNPQPNGSKKLKDSEDSYRIRVGDYRVIYELLGEIRIVFIQRVRHRKDVYRE
jgi:mRNA interferase RelE/StbE